MKNAYNGRIVNYEHVHGLTEADFTALLESLNLVPELTVLEGCVGYGAVARRILAAHPKIEITCYDNSELQLGRLRQEIPDLAESAQMMDMRSIRYPDNSFDRYVIKAGLQELPLKKQPKAFEEAFRVLKPRGLFVIWQPTPSERVREVFTEIVRKKDELAGFESMARNRFWNTLEEWAELFHSAGFTDVEVYHEADFVFQARNRASELVSKERLAGTTEAELKALAEQRVSELVSHTKTCIPAKLIKELEYKDIGYDFSIRVPNLIIRGRKA